MQFLEDLKKFTGQLKAEHEEADLDGRMENYGAMIVMAVLGLIILAVVIGLLVAIVGKLLPLIIIVALGFGGYVLYKKNKS